MKLAPATSVGGVLRMRTPNVRSEQRGGKASRTAKKPLVSAQLTFVDTPLLDEGLQGDDKIIVADDGQAHKAVEEEHKLEDHAASTTIDFIEPTIFPAHDRRE